MPAEMKKVFAVILVTATCVLSLTSAQDTVSDEEGTSSWEKVSVLSVYHAGAGHTSMDEISNDQAAKSKASKQYQRPVMDLPDSFYIIAVPIFFLLFFSLISSYLKNDPSESSEES